MNTSDFASSFSLRDYVAYLFPGVAGLLLLLLIRPDLAAWAEKHALAAGVIIIVGGYLVGFIAHGFFWHGVARFLPNSTMVFAPRNKRQKSPFSIGFNELLDNVLASRLRNVAELEQDEIFYLAWRLAQRMDHPTLDHIARLVTFSNISGSLSIVLFVAACWFSYEAEWLEAGLLFALAIFQAYRFGKLRLDISKQIAYLLVANSDTLTTPQRDLFTPSRSI